MDIKIIEEKIKELNIELKEKKDKLAKLQLEGQTIEKKLIDIRQEYSKMLMEHNQIEHTINTLKTLKE
jgi:predicted  nucleic acid-binding Zn-ribbon protein